MASTLDLLEWAKEQGIESFSLSLTSNETEGTGVVATAAIVPGSTLISAPMAAAVTTASAVKRFGHLWSKAEKQNKVFILAMELLHYAISHEDEVWTKALPSSVGNWLEWTSADKDFLRRCNGVAAILDRQEAELKDAELSLLQPVQAATEFGPAFTRDKYRWAVSLAYSRAFQVELYGEQHLVVIPLVDMLNHAPPPPSAPRDASSVSFDSDTMRFLVRALHSHPPGEEVFITYGAKSNAELLVNYGFCLPPPLHCTHSVSLSLALRDDDPLRPQKLMMLPRGLSLSTDAANSMQQISWRRKDGGAGTAATEEDEGGEWEPMVSPEADLLLRLSALGPEDLFSLPLLFQHCPASPANHAAALDLLARTAQGALAWCEAEASTQGARPLFVARLQHSDAALLKAIIAQAEQRKSEPLPEPAAAPDDDDDY